MKLEVVYILTLHRKLGYLVVPYVIERKAQQSFFQLVEHVTIENTELYKNILDETDLQLVKITSGYSEKNIHKNFAKRNSLKEFFDTLEQNLVEEHIRPYIEKRIISCIELLVASDKRVYKKDQKYNVVHDDERIKLTCSLVQSVFNFVRTDVDFKYFLSLRCEDKDIKLFGKPYFVLSNQLAIVVVENVLYQVSQIDSKKLIPFFSKDYIKVPKTSEKSYLETFVRNAILHHPVKVVGFKVENTDYDRKAILVLDSGLSGQPVFMLLFYYGEVKFEFGSDVAGHVGLKEADDKVCFYKTMRNLEWEETMKEKLVSFGFRYIDRGTFVLHALEGEAEWQFYEIICWINSNTRMLLEEGFELDQKNFDKNYYLHEVMLKLNVNESHDWFDVNAVVTIGEYVFPFSRFRKHIMHNLREFTLPNNQVVILPLAWFTKYRELFVFGEDDDERIRLKKHHFNILKESMGVETKQMIMGIQEKLSLSENKYLKEPQGLQAKLRQYQKTGVKWMFQLYKNKLGGCLADDMGLGKTLQTIALLMKVREEELRNPAIAQTITRNGPRQLSLFDNPAFTGSRSIGASLIVMPVSLLHNWEAEFKKFAPSLHVVKFFGSQRMKAYEELLRADVVLMSYGVVRNDIDRLSELMFKYVILDESQMIKNPDSKIYKAILRLQSEYRLVLTGTPIENSLTDLWSQLNFLNRELLKSQNYFREEFVLPIEKYGNEAKQQKLKMLINPFILRRKKEEVVKELPPLTEQTIYCEMDEVQAQVYEQEKSSVRNMIMNNIDQHGFEKSAIVILKALNRLRLMSNHPCLVDSSYEGGSGKYDEIIRSIENVIVENHKVLIFSSYVKHLNLIAGYLDQSGYKYSLLTGATHDRKQVIERFQGDEENNIFLISLKAGGVGLNLTAADYVFIIDPWWNPAAENQAISRAHRIGQDKKVFVYRFITSKTVEEKILKLQEYKSGMAKAFINSNNPFKALQREDIESLFL